MSSSIILCKAGYITYRKLPLVIISVCRILSVVTISIGRVLSLVIIYLSAVAIYCELPRVFDNLLFFLTSNLKAAEPPYSYIRSFISDASVKDAYFNNEGSDVEQGDQYDYDVAEGEVSIVVDY